MDSIGNTTTRVCSCSLPWDQCCGKRHSENKFMGHVTVSDNLARFVDGVPVSSFKREKPHFIGPKGVIKEVRNGS